MITLRNYDMKKRTKKNDIRISESEWIEWVNIDYAQNVVNIDCHIEEMRCLWNALELACVRECCGIYAFDLTQKNIKSVANRLNAKEVNRLLLSLIAELDKIESSEVMSAILNQRINKNVFRKVIQHIGRNIA
ncbi:hypothetical protein P886_2347 [Alteromonadaceae bacterium 2753L.S.0a.02]|nr:hypothetical protein P886_2347 [Alteromonadaceae bacterium 2753L.S.0a.02]